MCNGDNCGHSYLEKVMMRAVSIAVVKYEDRGPDNITQYGANGIILRMADKMARFKKTVYDAWDAKLPNGGISNAVLDKVVSDAYDMINYSAFMIMLLQGNWGKDDSIPSSMVKELPKGEEKA